MASKRLQNVACETYNDFYILLFNKSSYFNVRGKGNGAKQTIISEKIQFAADEVLKTRDGLLCWFEHYSHHSVFIGIYMTGPKAFLLTQKWKSYAK